MRPRFPESREERAARLVQAIRRMPDAAGSALESRGGGLPARSLLEQRIAARLKETKSDVPNKVVKALAKKKARDGYDLAKSVRRRDLRVADLTEESVANLEAVIRVSGRPAWFVRENMPQTQETASTPTADEFWIAYITAAKKKMRDVCARVGCIILEENGARKPAGTDWMIGARALVTNAHVAALLAFRNPAAPTADPRGGWRLRPDRKGFVDFAFENGVGRKPPFPIAQVLYVQTSEVPDIAVFRLEVTNNGPQPPAPIELDLVTARPAGWPETKVFALGHPVADLQDDANVAVVFGQLDGTKRISPGELIELLGGEVLTHDCSTTNGSSGSPLIDFGSWQAIGLHYYGTPGKRNEAVFLPAIAAHPAILKSRSGDWDI